MSHMGMFGFCRGQNGCKKGNSKAMRQAVLGAAPFHEMGGESSRKGTQTMRHLESYRCVAAND